MRNELSELKQRIENTTGEPFEADESAYLEQIESESDLLNCVDDGTGRFSALAYDAAVAIGLSVTEANKIADSIDDKYMQLRKAKLEQGLDFSSSGLCIGGAGSHDLYGEMLDMVASGQLKIAKRGACSWNGSRYDERCSGCGSVTMICNDCELCEDCHD